MRLRQRRGTGVNRKAIGAAVFAGVLTLGGLAGVQLASAGTTTEAADVIVVDGQNFDVSQCKKLEINAGAVVCDGAKLAPQQDQGADQAAQASAVALEASCDQFAADAAAADQQAGAAGKGDAAAGKGDAAAGADQAGAAEK